MRRHRLFHSSANRLHLTPFIYYIMCSMRALSCSSHAFVRQQHNCAGITISITISSSRTVALVRSDIVHEPSAIRLNV